jgi:uncharacterized protein
MSSPPPGLLDPWRAVDDRSVFTGRLPLSSLPRLCSLLLDTAGDAAFRLAFFRDEEHRAVLRCGVRATLKLRCQRCLEALDYQVDTIGLLALVSGIDEGRRLPERYDPLLVGYEPIRPRDSIEDELLLALPHIPMHPGDACGTGMRVVNLAPTQAKGAGPFAVLAELKRRE